MVEWTQMELRPLFEKLLEEAENWKASKVLTRTERLGKIVVPQLEEYSDGKYRVDRNESIGFFDAITKFAKTELPLSLDHFANLINQYKDRIQPYPHYSGIKVTVPLSFDQLDEVSAKDIPEDVGDDDDDTEDTTVKLM